MQRKVVKLGPSTLVVSLPSKWARKHSLAAGDEITIDLQGSDLLLSAERKTTEKKELVIQLTDHNKEDLKELLTHAYRKGFNTIIVQHANEHDLQKVKKIVHELLLGFELTNSSKRVIYNI